MAHAYAIVVTGTKDLGAGKVLHAIGDVDVYVAMLLHGISVALARSSFAGTKDTAYTALGAEWGVVLGSEINNRVMDVRLLGYKGILGLAVVIASIAAAVYGGSVSLQIFYIGGCLQVVKRPVCLVVLLEPVPDFKTA